MDTVNPEIQDMVMQKKLSPRKIRNLILIKKMVDRLASKPYLSDEEVTEIEGKYGVQPDIITWGDYFQTELASEHWEKSEADFESIIQTVTFDLIASLLIFGGKEADFIEQVRENAALSHARESGEWELRDEENVHLGILVDYYEQMQLEMENLSEQDFAYFEQFASQKKVS